MTHNQQDKPSQYKVDYVVPATSKVRQTHAPSPETQSAIVASIKVSQEGYIPPGIQLRSRISPYIFTATIPADALESIKADEWLSPSSPAST